MRTARAGRRPARAARRGHRRRPPPTCPTPRRSATATASARARSSTRSATRGLGSTLEVVSGHPRRRGLRLVQADRRASCSPSSAAARPRRPTYLCPCRRQTREELAARRARARPRVGLRAAARPAAPGRDCGACKPGLAYLVSARSAATATARSATRASSTTASTRTSRTTARSASSRASAAASPRADELRRIADVADRHEVPMVKITGGQRIDLLGVKQGAAAGDLGGARHALRPRLRQGGADGQDVRRHRLLPLRARRRDRRRDRARAGDGRASTRRTRSSRRSPAARATAPRPTSRTSGSSPSRAAGRSTSAAPPARTVRKGDLLATVADRRRGDPPGARLPAALPRVTREYLERTYGYIERVGIEAVREAVLDATRDGAARALPDRQGRGRPGPVARAPRPGPPQAVRRARHRARARLVAAAERRDERAAGPGSRVGRVDDIPLLEGRSVDGRRPPDRGLPPARRLRRDRRRTARTPTARWPTGSSPTRCVTCPLHGRRFDLRTRRARSTAPRPCAVHEVASVDGDALWIAGSREPRGTHQCPYCGVGCGLVAEVARRPAGRGRAATRCTRSTAARPAASRSRLPEAVHAPDRATDAAVARVGSTSAGAPARWRDGRRASLAAASVADAHGPTRSRFYISGQLLTEDYYAVNKLAKGFLGTNNVDSNSRLCMSSAVAGYTRRVRLRRAAAVLRRHRRRPTACCSSARTPSACHPIVWTRIRAARRGRVPDRRRPAPHADRRARRPAPAGPARRRPAAAERDARTCSTREGLVDRAFLERHTRGARRRARRSPPTGRRSARPRSAACPPRTSSPPRARSARARARDGAVVDGRQPVDRRDAEEPRAASTSAWPPATSAARAPGPLSLTGQPNAMGGRETGGLAHLLPGYRKVTDAEDRAEMRRLWDSRARRASRPSRGSPRPSWSRRSRTAA